MGSSLSDGAKIAITMVICSAVIAVIMFTYMMMFNFNEKSAEKLTNPTFLDHEEDFTAMAVYGDSIPMPQVVAALQLYGYPEAICVQLEDLKGEYGGTPYPTADWRDEAKMKQLIDEMKKHYDMQVYVYTAYPNGNLQLCVSELSHEDNRDGRDQWD